MKFFGVSYKKAIKLKKQLLKSELFIYHASSGHLFAKTFKSKEKVLYGKGKKRYVAFADYCYKMQMSDTINLREAVRELRNILITCAINSRERDNLNIVGQNQYLVEHPKVNRKAITQKYFGFISGLSRSSAGRYVKRLMDDGRVSKTQIVAECVIPDFNAQTEREWRRTHPYDGFSVWHCRHGWSAWQHQGCIYALCHRKDSDNFRHVIYNYRRGNTLTPKTSAEIDGKWND